MFYTFKCYKNKQKVRWYNKNLRNLKCKLLHIREKTINFNKIQTKTLNWLLPGYKKLRITNKKLAFYMVMVHLLYNKTPLSSDFY